jgi:hypothetical protein
MKFQLDLSNVGGMPFELDDLDYLQNGVNEAFKDLLSTFDNSFVLTGCEVTTAVPNYNVSAGIIVLEGEVLPFAGGSIAISINPTYFELAATFDPAGNEVFQDTNTFDTYAIRSVVLATAGVQPANTLLISPRITIHDIIRQKAGASTAAQVALTTNWTALTLTGSATSIVTPEYMVKDDGQVLFRGSFQTSGGSGFMVSAGGLPSTVRPGQNKGFVNITDSPLSGSATCEIQAGGGIFVNGVTANGIVYLDSITYFVGS